MVLRRFCVTLILLAASVGTCQAAQPISLALPGNQTLSVPWPQSSINLSQLQGVFAANPGFSQYNIQFPNGVNWGVAPNQIQSLYNNYQSQAKNLGYNLSNGLPNLTFSSLGQSGWNAQNITLSVQDAADSLQSQLGNFVRNLRYQQLNLDNLPDWLKSALLWVYSQFVVVANLIYDWVIPYIQEAADYTIDKVRNVFR